MPIRYQQLPENKALPNLFHFTKQQGSSLILALFVIIILTLLGSILMRIISTSSETVSQEVLGTRAYMAANSAMQAELQKLFPLNGASAICNADNTYAEFHTPLGDDVPGLYDCRAGTTCENYYIDTQNPLAVIEYYRLTSTGKCGSGIMEEHSKNMVNSSRTIQVEARSL